MTDKLHIETCSSNIWLFPFRVYFHFFPFLFFYFLFLFFHLSFFSSFFFIVLFFIFLFYIYFFFLRTSSWVLRVTGFWSGRKEKNPKVKPEEETCCVKKGGHHSITVSLMSCVLLFFSLTIWLCRVGESGERETHLKRIKANAKINTSSLSEEEVIDEFPHCHHDRSNTEVGKGKRQFMKQ